jgi:hypothetical protein
MNSRSLKKVLVVGGGKFGEKATRLCLEKGLDVRLIDKDPRCPAGRLLPESATVREDAGFAFEKVRAMAPDLVVPTVPRHLVAEWMVETFAFKPWRGGVEALGKRLPESCVVSVSPGAGILTLSLADPAQVCPEDCPGPRGLCTATGKPRREHLRDIVESASAGLFDLCRVLIPQPLGRGIGALRMSEILSLEEEIQARDPRKAMIATASACHGVVFCGFHRVRRRQG